MATKPATKPAKPAKGAKPVQATAPAAAPIAQPVAPVQPATVALRGGPAVQRVALTGKLYRSAAAHNTDWWKQVQAACASGPAPVATLLEAKVPAHFIGYTMRRGYLVAA